MWVPPPGDDLVLVGGNHQAGQVVGEVPLQVRQHDGAVIAGGEQVEGGGGEADTANIT